MINRKYSENINKLTSNTQRDLAVNKQSREAREPAERDGDIREHDEVRDEYSGHVGLRFPVEFVFNGPFGRISDVHVRRHGVLCVVLHEFDELFLPFQCGF